MAVPLIALALAGGAMGAYGSLEEGRTNELAARQNADTAEWNAKLTRRKAKEDERYLRVMARKDLGQMRANYGASGITTEGSAMDVLMESAATAERDALNIRQQGEMQAQAFEKEARVSRQMGSRYRQAGQLGAAASLLGGFTRSQSMG